MSENDNIKEEGDKDSGDKKPYKEPEKINLPDSIPDNFKQIFEKLPQDDVKELLLALTIKKSWSGPLPAPDNLREYNEIIPNGAERIYLRSEKQSDYRMKLENLSISTELRQSGRGQHYGLIIALAFLIGAVFLAYTGHEVVGGILGSLDIIGLISIFVYGKKEQTTDLIKKKQ